MSEPAPPLHVAHFLPDLRLEQGGVVRTVVDLCGAMARRGHRVTLFTDDAKEVPAEWHAAGQPRIVIVPRPRAGLLSPRALRAIGDVLTDVDVLHLHGPWLPANLQLASLARRRRLPYVVSIHGMLDDWSMSQKAAKKRVFLALGARRMLEQAAYVHCTADEERRQSARWYPRGRPAVIQCMCDLTPFADARHAAPDPSPTARLLFLSRVHPKKGVELLIDAVALLRGDGLDVDLTIAGPGDEAYVTSLRRRIASAGLESRARLVGMIRDPGEKVALYAGSDLFVLPTSQENFGIVLVEAMACGTPVVTTRGVAIWRELEEGGAIVVERSAEALARAIGDALRDRVALARRGGRARDWVYRYAHPDRVVDEFEALYRRAISGGRAP